MIVPAQHFVQVYQAMKKDSSGSEDKSVLVFAASSDIDSVCASQQLLELWFIILTVVSLPQNLLNRENIHFTVIPVQSYEEVRGHCEPLIEAEEVKTLILINCGATDDVRSLCQLPCNIRIVIIDNHRPVWHGHNNEEDNDTLVLVDDDDPVPKSSVPVANGALDLEVGEEDDDDSEDDDSDSESGDDDEEGQRKKRKRASADAGPSDRPAKRGPGAEDAAARAAARRQRAEDVDTYYSERNGYGKPTSLLLFSLCHELQHDDCFHVWLAITALTEQLIFQQISKQQYNTWREVLAQHVKMHQDPAEEEEGITLPKHKVQVEVCEDLRLTLMRHWTMEDSLRYTTYVAARLQTWRQKGLDNIRSLLTYMCIPLKHASTAYKGLREVYFGQLRKELPRVAPKHMLAWDSLHMESFRMLYKHEEVSASDMVFALLGLLTDVKPGEHWYRDAFNKASSALHVQKNLSLVKEGIELAKQMCQEVVHDCGMLVTNNNIRGGRAADYRYINITETNMVSNVRFTHPTVLKYAALFLRDATSHRYNTSDARRPMVVAGPPDELGACCVVAVQAKHTAGNRVQVNPFARPLLDTVGALGISQFRSGFDNSTYHLRKEELAPFLAKLHDIVGEYRLAARVGAPVPE
ncbi:Cell division control protein 45 [Tetrabaena socialis]|uniref:Cell division control protein 45 n=1 Tax=Tetrabaena socialis TaxID=47790 RepID=A0A2J7ZP40_9CHLO|nr:Cell division control protein 45 [Tetrabaena socialis]|eukprot:PNH02035.1 Cell division control protein 45 [Tetrabaena socialis]